MARRIVLFAILAMLAQLLIVLADYYWNDEELGRLLVEQEVSELAKGIGTGGTSPTFDLPPELSDRYGSQTTGYFARIRDGSGRILFSNCTDQCAEHFLPVDLKTPDFWLRIIEPGKPLTLAGGETVEITQKPFVVEIATIGDPVTRVNAVLSKEVIDHMIVPMGILVIFVLGATLLSITTALRPVRGAAREAAAIDAADPQSRLDTVGMPLEVAQLAAAVNEAFDRVRHLMQAQKLLTSAIAHEVRTPLAVIKLELEQIVHPRARKAEKDLDELVQFVQQLSALGNLDGVDRKQFLSTNINKLTEELVESLAPWVYQTRHSIAFEQRGQLIVPAVGSLIRDALRNLIENAVKHTEAGTSITVRVDENGTVGVYDNGGPPRWPETPVKRDDGNVRGIGLEIINRIATIHGSAFRFEQTRNGRNAVISFPIPSRRSANGDVRLSL
ncbi:ATP-binding protein [Phyllobacterium sp. YR620]|uniref:sensor histidine kinase n=1 Tax=Phyllobacterium sp. YR620 TaxID=1881066 RepID=UPI001FCDACA8|nr:ATP-binding protein [Phyllobacterium sp. YR620]